MPDNKNEIEELSAIEEELMGEKIPMPGQKSEEKTPEIIAAEEKAAADAAAAAAAAAEEKAAADAAAEAAAAAEEKTPEQIAAEEAAAAEKADEVINPFDEKPTDPIKVEFDFATVAADLGFDNKDVKDYETFKAAQKKAIEDARQNPDLSKYDEQTQKVIDHIEKNGGSIYDFMDPLKLHNQVLAMDGENLVRWVLKNSQNLTEDQIERKINTLVELEEFTATEERMRNGIIEARNEKMNEIVQQHNERVERLKAQDSSLTEEEKSNIIAKVNSTQEFLGFTIPKEAREKIIQDVQSGALQGEVNASPDVLVYGYLFKKYGAGISTAIEKKITQAKNSGYNEAIAEKKRSLHNIPPETNDANRKKVNENRDSHPLKGLLDAIPKEDHDEN